MWIKLRTRYREVELRHNARTKEVDDYMKQIMPAAAIPTSPQPDPTFDIQLPKPMGKSRLETQTDVTSASVAGEQHPRPSEEFISENPKREPVQDVHDGDYDVEFLEEDANKIGTENVGSVASFYLMPYGYKRRYIDRQYGMRKTVIFLRLSIPRC